MVFLLHLGELGLFLLTLHFNLFLLLKLFLSLLTTKHLGFDYRKLTLVFVFVGARELLKTLFEVGTDLLNNVLRANSSLFLTLCLLLSTLFKHLFLDKFLLINRKFLDCILRS